MLLQEVFDQLSTGELRHLELGNFEGEGGILPKFYPVLINHINVGLQALHNRFVLSTKEIIIQQHEITTQYLLNNRFAVTNTESTELNKYIKDSEMRPFKNDLLKVERIYDECCNEVFLNDSAYCCSMFMLSYNLLQIPLPCHEQHLSIVYRAGHPVIKYTENFDPSTIELNLPYYLLEALLFYVASRLYATNGLQGQDVDSVSYFARYQNVCNRVDHAGLISRDFPTECRFEVGGWL